MSSGTHADHVAVVTGASSGIGKAIAERLVAEGARVVGIARDQETLARMERASAGAFVGVACDLASADGRAAMLADLVKRFPRCDVLVNNAAHCVYETPLELSAEKWRTLFEVNFLAAVDVSRAVVATMPAGSSVVNLSSVTTRFLPNARFAPYATTKAALEALTAALRVELAPRQIRVTLISPGLVDTPLYEKIPEFAQAHAKLRESNAVWLTPGDVADAVLWALAAPSHVAIGEISIFPRGQAR